MIWKSLVILVGSFFVGSLSLSILASKTFFGGDIREKGSGNAGATNMARVHGWGAGLLTLAPVSRRGRLHTGPLLPGAAQLQGRQGHRGRRRGRLRQRLARRAVHRGRVPRRLAAVEKSVGRLPVRGGRHRGVLLPLPCEYAAPYPLHLLRMSRRRPPPCQHQAPGRGKRAGFQGSRREEVNTNDKIPFNGDFTFF